MEDIGNRISYPNYECWKRKDGHHYVNMKPISEFEKFVKNKSCQCV